MNDETAPKSRSLMKFLPSSWRQPWLFGVLLVLGTLIAYGPALPAGFVWDDDQYVTENPLLTAPDGLRRIWFSFDSPSQYVPLTYTTFYLERGLWGLNPAGYHLINILLHAANALLLWWVLTRLRMPGAWLAAAIFALHPVQVESVAWITERKNVLMGFFFLLSVLAWIKFIGEQGKSPWRFYVLALAFYALSLFAKTTACTLPAALLLILWLEKKPVNLRRLAQVAPFVVMGIGIGLVSMGWEHHNQGMQPAKSFEIGPVERVLIACRALWFYVGKLLWPVNLTVNYPLWNISAKDPLAYGWVAATAALGVVIWRLRRWAGRGVEVALAFFVVTLIPMLGFIMLYTFVYSFVADHYQYMACIGPIALAAAGIEMGLGRIALDKRVLPLGLCAALLVTLGMLTWKQCRMYADNETLWQTTLRQNPRSVLAEVDLGTTAFKNGQVDKAIAYYQKALEINPRFSGVHYSLALTYFELGHFDEAVAQYKKEIEINPHNAAVRDNLGLALVANGKVDEAIAEFQKALAIQPNWAMAYDNLGSAFLKKGELDKAIANLQKGLQIGPSIASVQGNLGIAYAKKRQLAEALAHFKKAVENEPASAETCNNLAWLLATATDASVRNGPKALALAQSVLQMTGPDDPMALQTLGAAEAATGNFKEAVNIARRALELADRQKNQSLAGSLQQEIRLYKIGVPERDTLSRWIW